MIHVGQGLCKNKVLHRHLYIVFLPNQPIAILELPKFSSHEWLTLPKRCYWFVRQEYNRYVRDDEGPHFSRNQNKNIENDLHCNSNEFQNHLC